MPLGALCTMDSDTVLLRACVVSPDGQKKVESSVEGTVDSLEELIEGVIENLRQGGADEIIKTCLS